MSAPAERAPQQPNWRGAPMATQQYVRHHRWERPAIIGFLGATKRSAWSEFIPAFEGRLQELGWIPGHNLEIDYQWAKGRPDLYEKIVRGFVDRGVDVIVTAGTPAVAAAMRATKAVPIVFASAGDPVHTGLVRSLAHPGGNVTGVSNGQTELAGKRLDLLRQAVPGLHSLALMGNGASRNVQLEMNEVEKKARRLKIGVIRHDVRREPQIASAIKQMKDEADALYICTDPFATHYSVSINTLAAGAGLPTMHAFPHQVESGGLLSYGPDFHDLFHDAADIVDRILRGAKPGDIPVRQEKRSKLALNLNTAKALAMKIPSRIRRRAEASQ
jgi:ABC-type uncharacterized transport system substrate-binding protein